MHTGQILFATKLLTGQGLGSCRHLSAGAHGETTSYDDERGGLAELREGTKDA